MNTKKGFKGFTLVELVIVLGVVAILSAVLVPTFVGILNNSKVNAKYERASSARTDFFVESDDFEALSDMRKYLILVDDDTLYEVNSSGDIVLSDYDFEEYAEDGDYIEVQRAYDTDESVKIYQPSALDAYGRAIKARNDYRRSNGMDRTYFEMDNYIIKVSDDDTPTDRYFKVVYEGENSGNNGALIELDQDIESLLANGYEYVKVTEGEDTWYGIVYKPTVMTQLTYRISGIENELLTITHNDENMKEGDFVYVIDGAMYVTDGDGIVSPLNVAVKGKTGIQLIDAEEVPFDDSELIANGYQKIQTDVVADSLRNSVTEVNRGLSTYSPIACYVICYGYYDTTDTYQTWTTFRGIYGSEGEVNSIVYKAGLSVTGIKRLIVSNTVTTLGYRAFAEYEDMEAIVLPETIDTIALNPLANAKTTEIRIHHSNGIFEDYEHTAIVKADENLLIAGTRNLLDDEESVLPDSITSINDYAFESTTLTTINIVGLEVGKGIFKDCVSLVNVTHDLDTEIPDEMFSGCVTLEYFTMPVSVEVIGEDAFKNCVTILELDLPVTLTEIKTGAFDNDTMTLYYADSRKTFNDNVIVSASLSTVTIEYAIKDIVYVLGAGSVDEETPNPLKLDPTSEEELVLYSPFISYKWRFVDWSVKGTLTNNPYENITAGTDLEHPYKLLQSDYNEDITLTANYDLIVYDIAYRINGTVRTDDLVSGRDVEFTYEGTFLGEYNTTVSATINVPQLDKIGYTFEGWSLNGSKLGGGGSTLTQYGRRGNITLTAVFNVITYTISYDYVGGTVAVANTTSYTIESPTINISNPTKRDYIFTGWTGSNGNDPQLAVQVAHGSVGDKTYTANYEAVVYNLTYYLDGGTLATPNPSTFTVDTEDYELNEPTKRGYTFKGWHNGITNIGTTFDCSEYHENTRLTALFEANVYTITYAGAHIDQYNNATTYTYDTTTSLKLPNMATGYRFVRWTEEHGWVEDGYLISDDTHAIGNITITGVSEAIVYTISYTLNKGDVDGTNPATYTIESADITLINPTRIGYDFRGWTGSNGNSASKSVTIRTGSVGNKTYTANWDLITYTISYTLNNGIVVGNPTEYNYESSTIVISNPTRTGYTFAGWTGTKLDVNTNTVTIPNHSTGNRSYTANWNVINYALSYTLNGGTATNPATYNIETATFKLNNPTKTAYEFTGWTGTDITGKSLDVTISKGSIGARSFTATYTPIIYTISYDLKGGTVATTNPTQYNIETATFTLNNPTREGYTFDGWTGTNGSTAQTTITIAKGSMNNRTYTANWTVITYTLSYTLNSGTVSPANPTSYNVETATFVLTNPTRRGYTFNGWTGTGITGKSTAVTIAKGSLGNRSYTADFTRNTYTISYTYNGGTISGTNPGSFHVETPTFTLNNPSKTGYTFDGWSGTGISGKATTVTIEVGSIENRSYTANFTVITYTLSYTLNGGTATNPSSYTVESNQITLANPTKNGYTFDGWSGTDIDDKSTTVIITNGSTGNRSYTAHFTIITYTITYTLNSGTVSSSNPTTYNVTTATFTLNNPTKTGYTFDGWTGSNGTAKQTSVSIAKGSTGNKTYTANYTVITYTLTYTLNGGTVSTANKTSYNVETANFTLNNPTKTGYNFDGWTGSNGSTKQTTVTINKGSTGDKSYTANFSAINYTISYTYNGGSASGNKTSYNVETATFSLVNPTKTGYTFAGWTGSNGSTKQTSVSIAKGSTGNKSYTANWTVVTYTISYTLNSGTVATANPASYTIETATFTLNNPTRTGYTFTGWSGSGSGTSVSVTKGSTGNKSFTANWKANTYTVTLNGQSQSSGSIKARYVRCTTNGSTSNGGNYWYEVRVYSGLSFISSGKTVTTNGSVTTESAGKISIVTDNSLDTGYCAIGTGSKYVQVDLGSVQWVSKVQMIPFYNDSRKYNNLNCQLSEDGSSWTSIYSTSQTGASTSSGFTTTVGHGGSVTATYGSAMPAARKPFRNGYTFGGYYTSTGGGGTQYYSSGMGSSRNWNLTSNTTLYAKWTANTYTVTLNQQSGSGGTGSVTATFGSAMPSATKPSRTGYTFGGYYTSTGGGGTQYYNASMGSARAYDKTGGCTLYAKWTGNTYSIHFDKWNGWNGTTDINVTYGSTVPSISCPVKDYYGFAGYWTSSFGNGTQYYNSGGGGTRTYTTTGNMTLYAKWNRGGSQSGWYTSSASRNNGYPDRHVLEWWETGWNADGNQVHVRAYLTGGSTNGRYQGCGYRKMHANGNWLYWAEWNLNLSSCTNGYEIMSGDYWCGHYCSACGMSIESWSSHYYYTSWNSYGSGWWALTNW